MKDGSNNVHYISGGYNFQDGVKKLNERAKTLRALELNGGSIIAYSGTNNFTMTEGIVFGGLNKFIMSAYNSAVDTFIPIYSDGGAGFTEGTPRNTIDYNHYDDGDGVLGDVGVAKYSIHWIYRHVDDGDVYVRYGEGSYSLADAETANEPTKPDYLIDFGMLIGKIIAPQAGGSFAAIQQVTDIFFSGTAVSNQVENTSGINTGDQTLPVKATGAEVDTGTDDAKFATPKAIADSKLSYTDGTETLTNKRITARVKTFASDATPDINSDDYDVVTITAQAAAITDVNVTGTPTNFQKLIFRIKDNGTARAITWGSDFEADTVTSKWGCVAVAEEE